MLDGVVKTKLEPAEPMGVLKIPDGVEPMRPVHRRYLGQRRIDPDYAASVWGIMGIGLDRRLPWRLFLPVVRGGDTVSWTTRSVKPDATLRYVNAPPGDEAVPAKRCLFGADHVRHAAVIVEGPLDAVRVGPGAVAVMGTGVSKAQKALLADIPVRTVCFDNEPKALARGVRLARELAAFPGVTYFTVLETGKDPCECSESEIRQLRKEFLE